VNHALPPIANCECSIVAANGNYKVQLISKREIRMGEELFFDYSEEFKTDWKNIFDKKSYQFFKVKK
jgi:SET domain-containing protein